MRYHWPLTCNFFQRLLGQFFEGYASSYATGFFMGRLAVRLAFASPAFLSAKGFLSAEGFLSAPGLNSADRRGLRASALCFLVLGPRSISKA